MPQKMIVGRLFLAEHGIFINCRHRRLQFPESLPSLAVYYRNIDITQLPDPGSVNPIHQSDADQRPPSIPRRAKLLARSGQAWEIPTPREAYADPNLQEMQREFYELPRPKVKMTSLNHTQRKETKEAEGSSRIQKDAKGKYILKRNAVGWYKDRQTNVAIIGAMQLMRLVQEDSALYCTSINEIDDVLRQKNTERLLPNDDGNLRAILLKKVPEHYHDLLDVFSKVESDQVPPFRPGSDHNIQFEAIEPIGAAGQLLFAEKMLRANEHSPLLKQYRIKARNPEKKHWTLLYNRYVLYRGRLVIPGDGEWPAKVIREVHGTIATAHPGRNKTRRLVAQQFWWPGMSGMVDRYIANCSCRSAKVPKNKTPGFLQPLPVPDRQWSTIVVNFKSMPKSKSGNDNLFVIIDALTKRSWAVPYIRTATAKDIAIMYYEGPYRIYGLPTKVVSDRGPQFVSDLIDEMSKILQIKWKLSTAGHSQTAGQIEIMNAYIDQRLRPYINHFQDDWDKHPRNPLDGQTAERPEGEVIDASEDTNEKEWEIERVISSRVLRGMFQYQIQWRGWDPDPEFYDAEGFKNAVVQLRQYHNAYPDKAGPPMRLEAWEKAALEDRFDPPDEYDNAPATGNSTARRLRRRR
ncbi:uncharacterized protein PpBr36_10946 [Pyricularia pennisetigena]|uniref:uncharacterized protein n=2 Tax=Pyricularia pennisetigena TaxID=1578925 RepID=UPI001152339C|nr:uncharacterized protein PpBr36_10946 [Pyricularia pennisetigena]TLS20779.1 hypothetical protein PpBr36_10946 [Pyricularia pennisetigena]